MFYILSSICGLDNLPISQTLLFNKSSNIAGSWYYSCDVEE